MTGHSSQISYEWVEDNGILKPVVVQDGVREDATWIAQEGSQQIFINCDVTEVLYTGTRGGGKTDCLLMDFAQNVGVGYGEEWKGIIFRRTHPELEDIIGKSKKWFKQLFPSATYNEGKYFWRWPDGEMLMFRHFRVPDDYWSYHGHAYPWIGWEELTTWPDDKCFKSMFSCMRSPVRNIPISMRGTCNPYGVGHNWVKMRYGLPVPRGKIVGKVIKNAKDKDGIPEPNRVAINSSLYENKVLIHADPDYVNRIAAAARNKSEKKAWLEGDWNIVAGGMFDDVWREEIHVIPDIPLEVIPKGWRLDRSYDHGQTKPFSVGWWAESNGEPLIWNGKPYGTVRGDTFRIAEWYGWNGTPNEGVNMLAKDIAIGIKDREEDLGILGIVKQGVADTSIFDDFEPGKSVAGDMAKEKVYWDRADKGPGSRKQGWEQLRKYLKNSYPVPNGYREEPGLFIMEKCAQFRRTFPVLPRDDKDLDDVNTDAEDHIGDEVRYRLRRKKREIKSRSF